MRRDPVNPEIAVGLLAMRDEFGAAKILPSGLARFWFRSALIGGFFVGAIVSAIASPPIPYFTASSLQRGTIISHSSSSRVVGNFDTSTVSRTTEGIIGVKIQLRTFAKLLQPYRCAVLLCGQRFVES